MNGREVKSLIDYVAVDEGIKSWVQDAWVVRGKMVKSDHLLVMA